MRLVCTTCTAMHGSGSKIVITTTTMGRPAMVRRGPLAIAVAAWSAAVSGSTFHRSSARPAATGTPPAIGAASQASGSGGRLPVKSLLPYLLGPEQSRGRIRLSRGTDGNGLPLATMIDNSSAPGRRLRHAILLRCMSLLLAHRDESDSRLTCLKSGDKRTLVRSAIDANDPKPTEADRDLCGAHCRTARQFRLAYFPVLMD